MDRFKYQTKGPLVHMAQTQIKQEKDTVQKDFLNHSLYLPRPRGMSKLG